MAPRNGILRLALAAALAVLLSGCYAHGARHQYGYAGTDSHYGGSHQPVHGPGYHKHRHHKVGHHKVGHHRDRRHDRAGAQDSKGKPEGAQRTERRRQARRDSDRRAVRHDERRAAASEAGYDRGRGTAWMPGATARDEGSRPAREGASH